MRYYVLNGGNMIRRKRVIERERERDETREIENEKRCMNGLKYEDILKNAETFEKNKRMFIIGFKNWPWNIMTFNKKSMRVQ